ncbi:hypothetical protein MIND_00553700 [Mycena indigotica]|uniref:Uncharacterized protein n=1 Tax=Mycena indigotica TaxID=2126181 RepID=A0A8H6SX47_9AGAR|nr:uncharacterized protein MIND_00553700 [Mycena indigotica]KAF7307588.1 hypothetical protein MIND_00553700 [Mycena indigotica]
MNTQPPTGVRANRLYRAKPKKTRAEKKSTDDDRYAVVLAAAKQTVDILSKNGFRCAIFGGLACKLYGNSRCPNDVDIIVYPTGGRDVPDAEVVKQMIVSRGHGNYYLKKARNPAATYKILWYKNPRGGRRESKVDILVPSSADTMSLPPYIPEQRIFSPILDDGGTLPVAPFAFVLLHKLKGWSDHRASKETFKQVRYHTDGADIRRLLDTRSARLLPQTPNWWLDEVLFDERLRSDSIIRVQEYCSLFPQRAAQWRSLGIDVPDIASSQSQVVTEEEEEASAMLELDDD